VGVEHTSSCHLCHLPLQRATYTQQRQHTPRAQSHTAVDEFGLNVTWLATVGIDAFSRRQLGL